MDEFYCAFERRSFPKSDFVADARHGLVHVHERQGPPHSLSGYALEESMYPVAAAISTGWEPAADSTHVPAAKPRSGQHKV